MTPGRSFGTSRPSPRLTRLRLIRRADDEYWLLFSFPHILLDGDSAVRVVEQLVVPESGPGPRFGDYSAWLDARAPSLDFWRRELDGFEAPTPLPRRVSDAEGAGVVRVELGGESWRAVSAGARARGVTIATVLHGAWALLLARLAGTDDVLFGSTKSRSARFGCPARSRWSVR